MKKTVLATSSVRKPKLQARTPCGGEPTGLVKPTPDDIMRRPALPSPQEQERRLNREKKQDLA